MYRKSKYFKILMLILFIVFSFFNAATSPVQAADDSVDSVDKDEENELDKKINESEDKIEEDIDEDSEKEEERNLDIDKPGKKGDLYKTYKDEFKDLKEDHPEAGTYVDLMKKFNYGESKFECGKFDVLCHIINFFFQAGSSIINVLLAPMSHLAVKPSSIIGNDTFEGFKDAFNVFTNSLLGVFILFQIMRIYTLQLNDSITMQSVFYDKVVKVFAAGTLLFTYDSLFQFIMSVQYRINYGIFQQVVDSKELTNDLMLNLLFVPKGIAFLLILLVYAVLLLVLFVQMLYSFALIAVFYIVGPVAVTTMVNDEYNMFGLWLKTIVSRFLTLALQGLCVVLCFKYGASIDFIKDGELTAIPAAMDIKVIKALAFLLVGLGIPSLMKEFGSSSGAGRGMISGARSLLRR